MSAQKPASKFYSAEHEDEFLFVNDELQVSCVPDTNQSTNASHRRTDTSLRVQTSRSKNDSADMCDSPTSASLSSLVEIDPAEYDPEAEVGVQLMGMQDAEINLNHILASSLSALNDMTIQPETKASNEQEASDDSSDALLANELLTHRQHAATETLPSASSSGDGAAPADVSNEPSAPSTPQAKPRDLDQFQPTVLVDVAILSQSQTTSPVPGQETENKATGAQDPEYVVSAMKVDMCDVFVDTDAAESAQDPSHSVEERTNKMKATSLVQPLVERFEKCLEHHQQDNLFAASSSLSEIESELASLKRKHADDSVALDKLERFERVIGDNTDVLDIRSMMLKVETIASQSEEKDGWTEISNRKDIVTDIKEDTSTSPVQTIRVSGAIDSPLFHIIAVMNESELLPTVMPLDLTVKKLRQLSRFRQLVHMQIRMPWPFDNRDVVFVARGVDMLHDGRIVIVGESCKAYGNVSIPAPSAGCCRIETQLFGVVIKPISATQTHVCALAQLDLSVNTLPWGVLNYLTRHLAHIGFELFKEHVSQVMDNAYEQRIVENPDFYNHVYDRLRQYFAQHHIPKSATARADRSALVTSPASEAVFSPLQSPSSSSEDPRVCSRASGAMTSPSLHESELSCTHSESALATGSAPPALSPVTESADATHPSPVPVSLLGQLFRIPSTTRPPPPPGPPPVRPLPASATIAINAR